MIILFTQRRTSYAFGLRINFFPIVLYPLKDNSLGNEQPSINLWEKGKTDYILQSLPCCFRHVIDLFATALDHS